MSYLKLFFTFLKIGAFSFGGGYGVIPLIKTELVETGVISEQAFTDFIAISESTPGPFAVNIATFVGSASGGFLGAMLATLGVILPALIVMLLASLALKKLSRNKYFKAVTEGVQPFVTGLVLSTGVTLTIKTFFLTYGALVAPKIDVTALIITASMLVYVFAVKLIFKKPTPVFSTLIISAVLGIIFL